MSKVLYIKNSMVMPFEVVDEKVITTIKIGKKVVINPTVEQFELTGWEKYVEPEVTPEMKLNQAKRTKINLINKYDSSNNVNAFILGGKKQNWILPADRTNYLNTLQGAQRLGIEMVDFLDMHIPVDVGIMMLDAINVYALQCVSVTNMHKANVEALTTVEDVEAYDYTKGYPKMLNFDGDSDSDE